MDALIDDPRRLRRLKPRDWARLERDLRRSPVHGAHRIERANRRPELEPVVCSSCGEVLAEVRAGGQAWCPACRRWSGATDSGVRG